MKYAKPEVTASSSALRAIASQLQDKSNPVIPDRDHTNTLTAGAYEADE